MRNKILVLIFSFVIITSMSTSFSTEALEIENKLDKAEIVESLNDLSNGSLNISLDGGQVFISGKLTRGGEQGKDAALEFLESNKILFGIDSAVKDLEVISTDKDQLGHTFIKFSQVIDGLKVKGSVLNVHFDANGTMVSINGSLVENKNVESLADIDVSESEAIEIAKKQFTFDELRNVPEVEKLILTKEDKNYKVYKVNISYSSPDIGNYDIYVETASGEIIEIENNIRYGDGPVAGTGIDVLGKTKDLNLYKAGAFYQMKDVTKSASDGLYTYTMNNGTIFGFLVSNSTSNFSSEVYKAPVSAHYNAGKVIDFYKNLFSRNSLDDKGMIVKSYTHYGNNYNNAFWTGYEMVYGNGDGVEFTYLSGDLDVVGHEMTHGVITHTANLHYHNQSGALNESIADVFGVLISTYDKYDVASGGTWIFNTEDWVIGDEIYTPNIPGDAIRSLSNPTLYNQPDNMNNYRYLPDTEYGDWGGVHINSGILNKAAYNVAKSIGMEKTAKIYYRALVNYMSEYTDFAEARNCLIQAASDLYGINSAESVAVKNAFYSVGIGEAAGDYTENKLVSVSYKGHVQNIGWQNYVRNGELSGTEGQSLRVEGFRIKLENAPVGLNIKYKTHVQNIGWQNWVYDGAMAGTEGQSLRVEAIQIMLEGIDADRYTVQYQAHVQNEGWQQWVSNGQVAGSEGKSQRIEAIRIKIVEVPSILYQGHVQSVGWQNYVRNGELLGTEGQSLRVEGFRIKLENAPTGLKIKYRTHVQNIGWQNWVYDGVMAGTEGQSLRVEAIQIMLEGTDADKYTVQYQAHVQNEGWQPWVSNGQVAGSEGKSQRIEAIRIKITFL